ncbi:MAG TPA: hypothetical protein VK335_28755 [Bryobacteraceae bacterium]|nr:hypothetical protein [Bryobacteraceae bacterium]
MKLGAEPKKLAILIGLLLVAAYFLYTNLGSSPSAGSAEPKARPAAAQSAIPDAMPSPEAKISTPRATAPRRAEQEFRLSFKNKGVDPATIDPKLRLDLLAKVRSVDVGPAERNLFAWGPAPPPTLPPGVKDPHTILPKPTSPSAPGGAAVAGSTPSPPPITLKYYGYTAQRSDGHKRAFFSEGDCSGNAAPTAECDIFVAAEGDLILKRYKVVRIGASSAEVEDTQFNHKQPLPITQESPG